MTNVKVFLYIHKVQGAVIGKMKTAVKIIFYSILFSFFYEVIKHSF